MKLLHLINLGGPVNWVLTFLLVYCCVLIIERSIYFIETSFIKKKNYKIKFNEKLQQFSKLSEEEKNNSIENETTLLYYEMNRSLWLINFISAVAPSLGLLGTVTGLIGAFQAMSNAGAQVDIQNLSGGIWEAMLTTAFGMIISILALFFYRVFKRIIEKRLTKISLISADKIEEV